MTLKMNINTFSGKNIFVAFAKASIQLNRKIQTMCVKTNIRVNFTPPEVMEKESVKIIYCHHHAKKFMICQRVVEIRMNEGNKVSSKQMVPDILGIVNYVSRDLTVYRYDNSQGVYQVEIHTNLSLLQKFERFFEKIPHESSIAFTYRKAPLFPLFVKALLRRLGRKPPIVVGIDGEFVKKCKKATGVCIQIFSFSFTSTIMEIK